MHDAQMFGQSFKSTMAIISARATNWQHIDEFCGHCTAFFHSIKVTPLKYVLITGWIVLTMNIVSLRFCCRYAVANRYHSSSWTAVIERSLFHLQWHWKTTKANSVVVPKRRCANAVAVLTCGNSSSETIQVVCHQHESSPYRAYEFW